MVGGENERLLYEVEVVYSGHWGLAYGSLCLTSKRPSRTVCSIHTRKLRRELDFFCIPRSVLLRVGPERLSIEHVENGPGAL